MLCNCSIHLYLFISNSIDCHACVVIWNGQKYDVKRCFKCWLMNFTTFLRYFVDKETLTKLCSLYLKMSFDLKKNAHALCYPLDVCFSRYSAKFVFLDTRVIAKIILTMNWPWIHYFWFVCIRTHRVCDNQFYFLFQFTQFMLSHQHRFFFFTQFKMRCCTYTCDIVISTSETFHAIPFISCEISLLCVTSTVCPLHRRIISIISYDFARERWNYHAISFLSHTQLLENFRWTSHFKLTFFRNIAERFCNFWAQFKWLF